MKSEDTEPHFMVEDDILAEKNSEFIKIANSQQDEKARTRNGDTVLTDKVTTPEIPLAINGNSNPADSDFVHKAKRGEE